MSGTPTALVSTEPSLEVSQLTDRNLFLRLQTLQSIQHEIWPKVCDLNDPGMQEFPHHFQTGDSVYIRRQWHSHWNPVEGNPVEGTLPGASKDVCPATHSVDQGELNIKYLPASASQVQGIMACTTTT